MSVKGIVRKLLPVLFEDESLIAVGKPAGLDVGRAEGQEGPGLVGLMEKIRGEKLYVANRLSRYDSGVVLLCRTGTMLRHLREGLRIGRVEQEFLAVAYGKMKAAQQTLDEKAGTSRGKDRSRRKVVGPAQPASKPRLPTTVRRMKTGERRTLIACRTSVDSTHAMLAQLRSEGIRILGDRIGRGEAAVDDYNERHLHLAKISFFHPDRRDRLTITAPTPQGFEQAVEGEADLLRNLQAGLANRLPFFADVSTNACRLLIGSAEGVPGVVFDRYGDVGVLQIHEGQGEPKEPAIKRIAGWYRRTLDLRAVYLKRFPRDRTATPEPPAELYEAEPFAGEPVSPVVVIHENGLLFGIRPYEGYSVGLFLDQRDNRQRVRELAAGRSVLNLFAYTCGFSVAAAAGGATGTVSVDLSPKPLDWGKANFELNGLALEGHEFVKAEAADYLARAKKHERVFDLIIIDAPTFARGRKKGTTFSIKEDLPQLIQSASAVLAPKGVLLVSTNSRQMSTRMLTERVREGLRRRKSEVIATPRLPGDFDVDRGHSRSVIVRAG
jgi:23S rRNA (cytosine1962-C5)-methyltransferase